jgi:ligand-binding SRPBCC domain-containing protein
VVSSQWLARPPDEVLPFFASANNLDLLTPPWLKFEILNPAVEMRQGSLINYKLRLHGLPIRWQSEIIDWDPPYRFMGCAAEGTLQPLDTRAPLRAAGRGYARS